MELGGGKGATPGNAAAAPAPCLQPGTGNAAGTEGGSLGCSLHISSLRHFAFYILLQSYLTA